MSNQNEGPLDITVDTTKTSTVVPIIAEGVNTKWKLVKINGDSNDKGRLLKLEWDLLEPATGIDGRPIEPGKLGAKMFETIALYDSKTPEGEVPEWAKSMIAKRQDALLGTGDPGNTKGKPERPPLNAECVTAMLGQVMHAKMRVGKNQDGTPRSEFGALTFPGDVAA